MPSEAKKVMTFKSGNFVFSRLFDRVALQGQIIEARIILETISEIPILPDMAARLNRELIRRSIFSTAALEGNPLSEEQVGKILEAPGSPTDPLRAEREILNLQEAYHIFRFEKPSEELLRPTESTIKEMHRTITQKITLRHNEPGSYRNYRVQVGDRGHGGVYTPPKTLPDVQNLMAEFEAWINSPELMGEEALVRAALAHFHLAAIHPFGDGNGRVARLLEASLLESAGMHGSPLMMSNFYYQQMDDYYRAFSLAERDKRHDLTTFMDFVLTAVIQTLKELKSNVFFIVRRHSLESYLRFLRKGRSISKRQFDLMETALATPGGFILRDLLQKLPYRSIYLDVSERTARRDLTSLYESGLLNRDLETGLYLVNYHFLDGVGRLTPRRT